MGLLSYQKENFLLLEDSIREHNMINIIAPIGSGVKTVINSLDNDNYIIFDISPNNLYPYMDIVFSFIKNHEKLPHGFSLKLSPSISIQSSMPIGVGVGIEIQKDNQFSLLENSIIKQFEKILKTKNIVFVLIDENNTDAMSKKIVYSLLNAPLNKKSRKRTIVISLNGNADGRKNLFFKYVQNLTDTKTAIKELNLNPSVCLSNYVLSFIDKNIAADIGILKEIVDGLNSNKLDVDLNRYDTDNVIKKLIARVISSYKYGNAVSEILSILAISGESFNEQEFSFLLNKDPQSIKMLLDFACDKVFINNQNGTYKILFNLIVQMFSTTDDQEKNEIYKRILRLIDTYYPDDYEAKYKFANYANDSNCEIFLLQKLFSDIRAGKTIDIKSHIGNLTAQNFEYLKSYLSAIVDLKNNNFYRSNNLIETIVNTCNSPIKQEFALLLSQNLIKSIDSESRIRAIDLLGYNKTDSSIDDYLQYRLDTRKIAAYIHNGDYKAARSESNTLENELITKIKTTNSPGLQKCLNIIYRKYSNVHNYASSSHQIKMSVDYFDSCNDVQSKYIALNNLMAVNLINGDNVAAYDNSIDIEDLIYNSCNVQFHRKEIFNNNSLLLKYLQDKISRNELCNEFEKLYSSTIELADNILIASNYSVVLALNNRIDDAIKILREKESVVKEDREGIYTYRINGNLAIFLYIKDAKSDEPKRLLDSIKLNCDDIHTSSHIKQIERFKSLIISQKPYSLEDWKTEHAKLVDSPLNYLRLYERPFIFTALFDWDDE